MTINISEQWSQNVGLFNIFFHSLCNLYGTIYAYYHESSGQRGVCGLGEVFVQQWVVIDWWGQWYFNNIKLGHAAKLSVYCTCPMAMTKFKLLKDRIKDEI